MSENPSEAEATLPPHPGPSFTPGDTSGAPVEPAWGFSPATLPAEWGQGWGAAPIPAAYAQYPAPGTPAPAAVPVRPERIGRGLVAAAVVLVACSALAAFIYHLGIMASFTGWLMAAGATLAYSWAAGRPPARGRLALIGLIVAGIVLGCLAMEAGALWTTYWKLTGPAGTNAGAVSVILANLFNPRLVGAFGRDAILYFVFAGVGAFSLVRGVARSRWRPDH